MISVRLLEKEPMQRESYAERDYAKATVNIPSDNTLGDLRGRKQ